MTTDRVREVVDTATENAVRDITARRTAWTALVLLVAFLAAGAVYFGLRFAAVDARSTEQAGQVAAVSEQSRALADQVRSLGGTPVVEPGVPGQRGDTGATGPTGPPGPTGPQGMPGATGQDGSTGPTGTAGSDGTPGDAGQDGGQGPAGPAGPQGPAGPEGPQGASGPACPDGYEPRPARITAPEGSTYDGVACVDPGTSRPPEQPGPLPG